MSFKYRPDLSKKKKIYLENMIQERKGKKGVKESFKT